MSPVRKVFAVLLIISMIGLGVGSLREGDYKTFALGCSYAVANVLIFLVK